MQGLKRAASERSPSRRVQQAGEVLLKGLEGLANIVGLLLISSSSSRRRGSNRNISSSSSISIEGLANVGSLLLITVLTPVNGYYDLYM